MKEAVRLCSASRVTALIWGNHGIGKSQGVAQCAFEQGVGFIDMRLSQSESSDLRGFPDKEGGRTKFCPPFELPVGGLTWEEYLAKIEAAPEDEQWKLREQLMPELNEGYLFLDELNRAQDDVLQAAFQLVLDRKVGQYMLPPGWNVVCASNPMEGYIVNGFTDPAFLDRFCHIQVSANEDTLGEWVDYISAVHTKSAAGNVIEFVSQNMKHLDGEVSSDLGFKTTPSRRSWDSVARVEAACESGKFSDKARLEVIAGLVGRELASSYSRYSCPVKPQELIDNGVEKMTARLRKLERNEMQGLMWGLVSFVKAHIETSDKHADVALDFAEFICEKHASKDLVVAFCKALISSNKNNSGVSENVRAAAISNPKLAGLISSSSKGSKKRFIDRLNSRKKLQNLLSNTAWGSDEL
jgi:hypothetical protein